MSLHDEYERAITGSSRKRSPLAWLLGSLAVFVFLGVVGVGFAVNRAFHRVERMISDIDFDPGHAATKVVDRIQSHTRLLSAGPEEGMSFLRTLDGQDPSSAFLAGLMDPSWQDSPGLKELAEVARSAQSATSAHAQGGEVHFDLKRDTDGGSLVIRSDDGEVRLDLRRTEDGGSLVIDTEEGQARVGLTRTDDGGFLVVDSDEGQMRFDLTRGDNGGILSISRDGDETVRMGFGDEADALPGWVPQLDGMPERPRPVYSLESEKGTLGAAAWEQELDVEEALASFQATLEAEGYEIRAEHHRNGDHSQEGSLWAKNEATGKLVFLVAHESVDGAKVLLGYGEEKR